jgi:hypothetical protein
MFIFQSMPPRKGKLHHDISPARIFFRQKTTVAKTEVVPTRRAVEAVLIYYW